MGIYARRSFCCGTYAALLGCTWPPTVILIPQDVQCFDDLGQEYHNLWMIFMKSHEVTKEIQLLSLPLPVCPSSGVIFYSNSFLSISHSSPPIMSMMTTIPLRISLHFPLLSLFHLLSISRNARSVCRQYRTRHFNPRISFMILTREIWCHTQVVSKSSGDGYQRTFLLRDRGQKPKLNATSHR